ncbi:peptide-N4-(N-acetyl-beta-glucosaminyl)asparagine amidase A-like [Bidens hawaiensis]|uniref:peptide-N4-(N-acetyl-beta- glucosaminyl)asparagine amidase A-like n=1 Tax=Bidens hawaiensis TaxID=980011 RepID=UPI00404B224A
MNAIKLLVFLPLLLTVTFQSSLKPPLSPSSSVNQNSTNDTNEAPLQQYLELTLPLPTNNITPACSTSILNHTFTNTTSVNVNYTPPPDTCEWSVFFLEFRVACKGEQHDNGIAGVWIGGIELLRTSTAQPTYNGVFWNVRKDVTRYYSVITQHNLTLSVFFQSLVENHEFNVVYNVSVSFLFYSDTAEAHSPSRKLISVKNYENDGNTPADVIIPISGGVNDGFWFRIHDESDTRTKDVQISSKAYKAVLELYVSFHGDDEFWYMNPPDLYIKANDLPITSGKGSYREVLVTIDGKLVGTVIPFPVIFPGGINPLFWKPVVSIGAFDLPSYDIDLTSYLGLFSDCHNHSIGIRISNGISFWLVDANLHVWLDNSNVQAIMEYEPPSMEIEHKYEFEGLDGEFKTEVERSTSSTRLVQSSKGVLKTKVTEEIKFTNKLKFKEYGTRKELEQKIKTKTKVKITDNKGHSVGETVIEKTYPLKITVAARLGSSKGGWLVNTTVIQGRNEKFTNEIGSVSRVLNHDLNCTGWMMLVKGNPIISGFTENHQNYSYMDVLKGCYSRKVDVVEGDVIADETTSICVN